MANSLNYCAILLQIWKQQKAKAEAFGGRRLKLQSIDGLFESRKFEKVKGSNIVKRVPTKYFSYLVDKIASLKRNLSKVLVIWSLFFIAFVIIFVYTLYELSFHLNVFQSELFRIPGEGGWIQPYYILTIMLFNLSN